MQEAWNAQATKVLDCIAQPWRDSWHASLKEAEKEEEEQAAERYKFDSPGDSPEDGIRPTYEADWTIGERPRKIPGAIPVHRHEPEDEGDLEKQYPPAWQAERGQCLAACVNLYDSYTRTLCGPTAPGCSSGAYVVQGLASDLATPMHHPWPGPWL